MQADRVQVLVQHAAAGNVEALVDLVQEFAPSLRLMLGAHLDQSAALVMVEMAVWSAVRTRLGEWLPETPFSEWLQRVAMDPVTTHLAHADRRAIDIQDALSHQIIEHCREAIANGSELGVVDLLPRIAALPETTRTLLLHRYRERQRAVALAASLMISEPELATSLVAARAACDWTGLAKPPGPGDRLIPPLIEDWLNGTIDVDSRALLATNVARDLERARQFTRQVRIHLALHAALAPFTREDAIVIVRQTGLGAGDSGRVMMGDASRTTSGLRSPTSDPCRPARMTTSGPRVASLGAEAPESSPMPWIIGGLMVLVGIFAAVVMSQGSGARISSPSRPANAPSAPTAIAPANTSPPSTPAPGSGDPLRVDPGHTNTAPQRPSTAPVVSITGAATSGKVCQDEPLELRASLSHSIGIKAVEFYHGDQRLGVVDVAPYRWTWEQPTAGLVSLTARVIGQAGVLATSPPVTLEILPPLGSGKLRREWWSGVGGNLVAEGVTVAGYPDRPQGSDEIDRFAAPQNTNDTYLQRLRGYLHPPLDGEYTFWIAADDEAQLWLSDDDTRARLRPIATASFADGKGIKVEEWERNKRQRSTTIHLRRGQRYYVEALHKEGTGDDHIEVGWQLPNGQLQRPIPGRHLSPANEPVAPSASVIAAPVVLPPASVTTPNAQTTAPTMPVAPGFVTGINFGGDAVVIDGNTWLGQKQAEEAVNIPGTQVIALSDLDWAAARSERGDVRKNTSCRDKPLTLRGVVHPKGFGVHAESEIVYALAGRYSWFTSDVGIDDETGGRGSVAFKVFLDGKQLFDSGVVTPSSPATRLNVPVSGGKELKLVVTDGGNGIGFDHADWAGPRLIGGGLVGGLVVKSGRRTAGLMNPKPAVDAIMRGMLSSNLVGTAKEALSFTVRAPPGSYHVYVWAAESSVANARLFDLHLDGVAMGEIGALPAYGWAKYGPFAVTVDDGELEVLAKSKKGVPQLTGIAIFESATAKASNE